MIKAYHLYTGADGHSHVTAGTVDELPFSPVQHIRFKESQPYTDYDWHNAPQIQYVITLSGTLEFTMRTGETFIVQPGEVLIATDTTGTGHKWRLIDDHPWKRVYVTFEQEADINFVPLPC